MCFIKLSGQKDENAITELKAEVDHQELKATTTAQENEKQVYNLH